MKKGINYSYQFDKIIYSARCTVKVTVIDFHSSVSLILTYTGQSIA